MQKTGWTNYSTFLVWSGKGFQLWMLSLGGSHQPFSCVSGHFWHGGEYPNKPTTNSLPSTSEKAIFCEIFLSLWGCQLWYILFYLQRSIVAGLWLRRRVLVFLWKLRRITKTLPHNSLAAANLKCRKKTAVPANSGHNIRQNSAIEIRQNSAIESGKTVQ